MKFLAIIICAVVGEIVGGTKVAHKGRDVTIFFIRHAQSIWNLKKALKKAKGEKPVAPDGPRQTEIQKQIDEYWHHREKLENDVPDVELSKRGLEQVKELRDSWLNKDRKVTCPNNALTCMMVNFGTILSRKTDVLRDSAGSTEPDAGPQTLDGIPDKSATQSCERPDLSKAVFGVSNLKRAIETLLIFLSGVSQSPDKPLVTPVVHILSALQERSGGMDAASTLGEGESPFDPAKRDWDEKGYGGAYDSIKPKTETEKGDQKDVTPGQEGGTPGQEDETKREEDEIQRLEVERKRKEVEGKKADAFFESLQFDPSENKGNNRAPTRHGLNPFSDMFGDFCKWVWDKTSLREGGKKEVLVAGHSSWLKKFFKSKLAKADSSGSKKKSSKSKVPGTGDMPINLAEELLQGGSKTGYKIKLGNASMIKFTLKVWDGGCSISRGSTQLVFGKWQAHKEKLWFRKFRTLNTELIANIEKVRRQAEPEAKKDQCPKADLGDE